MKRHLLVFIAISITAIIYSQAPTGFNYQAVARNAQGQLITNTQVTVEIGILKGSVDGTLVYDETFSPVTNSFGLVNLVIGTGTVVSGSFSEIDWGSDIYFIKLYLNSIEMGTSQLLSVPYAMHSKTAESLVGGIPETDPMFTTWDKSTGISIPESQISDLQNYLLEESDPVYSSSVASKISASDTTYWNNKLDSFTEVDPAFSAWDKSTGILITESQITDLDHFTNADETDPVYTLSVASGIKASDTTYWSNKLSSYTETDPLFEAWDKSSDINITASQVSDFQTTVANNSAVLANTAKLTYPSVDSLKLAGIQSGSEVNVNADWNATTGDAQILNQPVLAAIATSGSYNDLINKPAGNTVGDIQYWNGSQWVLLSPGSNGQVLVMNESNLPNWKNVSAPFLVKPLVNSMDATEIHAYSANINGILNANNLSTTASFEWGLTTSYENSVPISQNPIIGNEDTNVSEEIILDQGTTYHFRLKAVNAVGVSYSEDKSFTTASIDPDSLPIVTTKPISIITGSSANCGGTITSLGDSIILECGVCWSTSPNPTIKQNKTIDATTTGLGEFSSLITELDDYTTYYVRSYATNNSGITYGNEISFTTAVEDIDGNFYKTVKIGDQVWMTSNLKTTNLNNGTYIPLVIDKSSWSTLSSPGFCWFADDEASNKEPYGALYNWYTVKTGKLCPVGWHVPSKTEWISLVNYLGGTDVAGGKLKETGTNHWISPNLGATNETGFTAVAGGNRDNIGNYYSRFTNCWFWSATEYDTSSSSHYYLDYNRAQIIGERWDNKFGASIRCIKD